MDITRPAKETPHSASSASRSFASRISPPYEPPGVSGLHVPPVPPLPPTDPKKLEKEQRRLAKEAERERLAAMRMLQRERARAVMRKRQMIQQQIAVKSEIEFQSVHSAILSAQPSGLERRNKYEFQSVHSTIISAQPSGLERRNKYVGVVPPGGSGSSRLAKEIEKEIRAAREPPGVPELHVPPVPPLPPIDPKKLEKEQKRLAKEAEKEAERERLTARQKLQRERAQAVVRKRRQIQQQQQLFAKSEIECQTVHSAILSQPSGLERRNQPKTSGMQELPSQFNVPPGVAAASSWPGDDDVYSVSRLSVISFATVDSDPGPGRSVPRRGNTYGFSTGQGIAPTSSMSLQSYTTSPRTSHSVVPSASALSTGTIDPPFVSDFANQNMSDLTVSQYHTLEG